MNPDEAKQILSSYDVNDPTNLPDEALDALTLAQSDPELSAWLDESNRFDREFATALRSVEPPAGLDKHILKTAGKDTAQPVLRQRIIMLAVAASVVLLSGLGLLILSSSGENIDTSSDLRKRAARFASEGVSLEFKTRDLDAARDWLDDRGYPTYPSIPGRIVNFRGMGCTALDWDGHKIGLVCFVTDERKIVHLFIIDRSALEDSDSIGEAFAEVETHYERQTGGWVGENHVFLLVGSEPDVKIGTLLATK